MKDPPQLHLYLTPG